MGKSRNSARINASSVGVIDTVNLPPNDAASIVTALGATPVGVASTVTTNANLTGMVTSVGNAASLGSFTSAQLAGALTDETGTGSAVFATSPTLVTPILGTPTSGNLANCTGIPAPAALATASGSAPSYSARAWVNFNGTGTVAIRASGNVSSITDNGTGDYSVNFTTAMLDANYTAVTGGGIDNYGTSFANPRQGPTTSNISTSVCRIACGLDNASVADWAYVAISVFR